MASYKNRRDELVEVSEEHIATAIEIKIELQKESPSGKCSWSRHRRMMEQEGFMDSHSNESYRQMIKAEQKKRGLLPTATTHAELLSDNKLKSIKDAVGEMYVAKRANQNTNRELNKTKREIADNLLFFDDIKQHISNLDLSGLKPKDINPLVKTENSILINMSDWHIGLETESYNYDIAKKRVSDYATEIVHYAKTFKTSTVYVQSIGDLLEGAYMRSTQAFDIEFDYSEQIVKATEIVFQFLNTLAQELNVCYIGGLAGNHSRMYDKGKTLNGNQDSAENVVDATIKSFIKMVDNPRITVEDSKQDNSAIYININGRHVKSIHGDLVSKGGDRISKFISADNISYDVLIYGHFHHASMMEQNHDRLEIGVGCLYGTNVFSQQLGYDTKPSQTIVVFEGKRVMPIRIPLD